MIIGTGLIGASVGLNLISKRLASHVIGVGRGEGNLRAAKKRKAIHSYMKIRKTTDLFWGEGAHKLRQADLILLATPVQTVLNFLEEIPASLLLEMNGESVITDVGSTKQSIVKLAKRRVKGPASFVGGHPIAGTEKTGASAALADLFLDHIVILTPQKETKAVRKIRRLWQLQGARVITMTAKRHDQILAQVSHLPHMVAYSLVNAVGDPKVLSDLVAGGFRDITRIASSDPVMWRDICLDNRKAILDAMKLFEKDWNRLKKALREGDGQSLEKYFARAKTRRDNFK